ncbi:MAG: hypothetical protein MIO93_13055, partial [ANME-2 cluster archaeon]|nr:hypothetical protein [ANME-2 cluster archaeon]
MNQKKNNDIRSIRILLLLSIFLISTGLTVISSAEDEMPSVPNQFYGNVAYNGDWSQTGTIIEAYIDDELHSEEFEVQDGQYYIYVTGNNSDEGKTITFKLNGEITANTA